MQPNRQFCSKQARCPVEACPENCDLYIDNGVRKTKEHRKLQCQLTSDELIAEVQRLAEASQEKPQA